MKRNVKSFFLSVFFVLLHADSSFPLTVDRVIATVNNEIITLSDYQVFIARTGQSDGSDAVDESALKNLIEEKIILQEARKNGIDASDEEVEKSINDFLGENDLKYNELVTRLSEEGIQIGDYKKMLKENIISLKIIDAEVDSKVIVSDKDILDYYRQNQNRYLESPEMMTVMALFLKISENPSVTEVTDLKIKSLRIYERLLNGEPFEKMVALYSDEPLRSRSGMLGEFRKGELIPDFDRKLAFMEEGEISEPVWNAEGVHILKLTKRTGAVYTPLTEIRERIKPVVYEEKRKQIYNQWMSSLWEKAAIKIK